MTSKEKYNDICQKYYVPLFSKPYWMNAVCGEENWDVIFAEESGNILASLTYYIVKSENLKIIRKAPLTQNNGILFFYPKKIKYERKLAFEMKASNLIIDQIEKMGLKQYRQYFHYSFTNWLPFYWRNYDQTTRYTYIIDYDQDLDQIYNEFSPNVRTAIKKSYQYVIVKSDLDAFSFYKLNKQTFTRQGLDIPYTFELFFKLYSTLKDLNIVKILFAVDQINEIHSAALFVEDECSVYYLMSGSDERFRYSQSLTLLIYEGIKYAHSKGKKFDFEGSMKENIEHFNRQFGAKQYAYFDITKNFF